MQFDGRGRLVVADAVYGIYRVEVEKAQAQVLVPASAEVDGAVNKIFNSVAVSGDGNTIFYTAPSSQFTLAEGLLTIITAPTGRLIKYDERTNSSQVVMDGLNFANGVILSEKEDFILVNDCGRGRIWKYHLSGRKQGEKEVILSLPGCPDNLRPSENGAFLVALPVPREDKFNLLYDIVLPNPSVAKAVTRLLYAVVRIPELVYEHVVPLPFLKQISYYAASTMTAAKLFPIKGLVVEFDGDGNVLRSWHTKSSGLGRFCEATVYKGWMYLGSPWNTYLARVKWE